MDVAVVLVAEGVQPEEYTYPYYRLQEAGFQVYGVASGKIEAYRDRSVVRCKFGSPLKIDQTSQWLRTQEARSASIVICPGGYTCPETLRTDLDVLDYLRYMNSANRIIGGICHSAWILASAGILNGRKATCFKGMVTDLKNAGATYVDAPVVVDGNLISSPHYANCPEFMKAILEQYHLKNNVVH
jgi:protease I